MRTFGLLTLALASAQEGDETAYLLQTRTLQQKSGEVEDCFVSGGCVTTTTTEAPTTTTTEAPTTTTTEAPTTTTARPTRPATTTPRPTRPTRPATTTTEATTTTTPTIGEVKEPPPPDREVDSPPGVDPPNHNSYCDSTLGTVLSLDNPSTNNLGGMGPDIGNKEMRYDSVTTSEGKPVHLIITTDDTYHSANHLFQEKRTNGDDFVAKYNGDKFRSDVMAIGSLAKGDFTFKFSFVNDEGEPVVIPFLPMTFFDLDGSTLAEARGKSYEVVTTADSAGIEYILGSKVKHHCDNGFCTAESAKVEIKIPPSFEHLSPETKKAAVTFFFKGKSSFDITYALNYPHRVFLFKGQCIDEDDQHGKHGKHGKEGKDGKHGKEGKDGKHGKDGKDGKHGHGR